MNFNSRADPVIEAISWTDSKNIGALVLRFLKPSFGWKNQYGGLDSE